MRSGVVLPRARRVVTQAPFKFSCGRRARFFLMLRPSLSQFLSIVRRERITSPHNKFFSELNGHGIGRRNPKNLITGEATSLIFCKFVQSAIKRHLKLMQLFPQESLSLVCTAQERWVDVAVLLNNH